MSMTSLGDMAQHYMTRRQNVTMRTTMYRLNNELVTGKVSDQAAHLRGDQLRLASVVRRIGIAETGLLAANENGSMMSVMQLALSSIDEMRSNMFEQTAPLIGTATPDQVETAANGAKNALSDMVSALNNRFGGQSLFAGAATDGPALASADSMLTDLRAAITASGAVTVNDIIAEVDAWFAPGGDFDTAGYLGDLGDLVTRRIGEDTEITFEARADDPVLREVMAATALIALAADNAGTLPAGSGAQIVSEASERLLSTGSGMATLQGRVGQEEARVEEAKARLNAEVGAMSIMYNDMISADPFDTATALQEVQNQLEMHYALTSRLSELTLTRYL